MKKSKLSHVHPSSIFLALGLFLVGIHFGKMSSSSPKEASLPKGSITLPAELFKNGRAFSRKVGLGEFDGVGKVFLYKENKNKKKCFTEFFDASYFSQESEVFITMTVDSGRKMLMSFLKSNKIELSLDRALLEKVSACQETIWIKYGY